MRLVHDGRSSTWRRSIERLTLGPVRALGLDRCVPGIGTLAVGRAGRRRAARPRARVDGRSASGSRRKGKNTPLARPSTLRGAVDRDDRGWCPARAARLERRRLCLDALLVLEDGTVFAASASARRCARIGEVVFNTSMTGYQEIAHGPLVSPARS